MVSPSTPALVPAFLSELFVESVLVAMAAVVVPRSTDDDSNVRSTTQLNLKLMTYVYQQATGSAAKGAFTLPRTSRALRASKILSLPIRVALTAWLLEGQAAVLAAVS